MLISCIMCTLLVMLVLSSLGTCQKLAGVEGGGDGNRGRGHEKWAVKRGRIMQICVRDHVEVHPSFFIL